MFLYRFVRRRRRPQILVHAITFEELFGFLSFLARLLALTYRLTDLILVVTLTLNFQGQISNWLYLSQKWSDCHETKSKHIDWALGFKCDHRVWPWPWHWPWIFKVKCRIGYISAKNGAIATKQKANISIDLTTSNMTIGFDLGHDLDLEFSRSNAELAISLPKMVWLPQTKSKHINWTLCLKCDRQIWPWPWPWPWIFKVKYEICYISTKSGPIAMKQKANLSIWTRGLKCDNGFDLGHDIDFNF